MDIGIRLHDTKPGTLRERLGYAAAQGFTCVQLAMGKAVPGFKTDDAPALLTPGLAAQVRAELTEAGLTCAVLGCYLKLARADDAEAAHVQEIYKAHLRFAAAISAGCVGTETPTEGPESLDCHGEDNYRLFIDRVRPIVREAEECGAVLGIEPVCSHIVHDAAQAERMLCDLKSDSVRIILDAVNLIDSAHVFKADDMIADAVGRLGDRVCVLHMKDFVPDKDAPRPRAVPCGQGQMRYDALLKLARERKLPMTLENTTPDDAVKTRLYLESLV